MTKVTASILSKNGRKVVMPIKCDNSVCRYNQDPHDTSNHFVYIVWVQNTYKDLDRNEVSLEPKEIYLQRAIVVAILSPINATRRVSNIPPWQPM